MVSLRVEKTTRNRDDVRVLIAGTLFCIFMLLVQNGYSKFHDAFLTPRPFVTASVEIYHVNDDLPPLIKYDADANQPVSGVWIATVYSADGTRLNSRRGNGNYNDFEDDPKFWAWTAWFDNEQSDPPPIPAQPFYVCVRYDVTANDSGVDDSSKPYCSGVYDKNNPINHISEFLTGEIIR